MGVFVKRMILMLLLVASTVAFAAADLQTSLGKVPLKHKWLKECSLTHCTYKSSYKPPVPFTGKYEAMLSVDVYRRGKRSMDEILNSEVSEIRKKFEIDEQMKDDDGKPTQKGIATWKENLNGKEIGYIRYRVHASGPQFASITHAIILDSEHEYNVSLYVFFAKHEDEVKSDQLAILKALASAGK